MLQLRGFDLLVLEENPGPASAPDSGTMIAPIASILSPMPAAWAMLAWRRSSGRLSHGTIDGFVAGVLP